MLLHRRPHGCSSSCSCTYVYQHASAETRIASGGWTDDSLAYLSMENRSCFAFLFFPVNNVLAFSLANIHEDLKEFEILTKLSDGSFFRED